jgi:hypothetical protein
MSKNETPPQFEMLKNMPTNITGPFVYQYGNMRIFRDFVNILIANEIQELSDHKIRSAINVKK